jgi:fatty-acyl-CoA synthase
MTETSPCSFQSATDDPLERRVTTVGRIQPYLEAKVIDPAGWMHTGDLVRIDDEGYCSVVGRIKDVVIRGGQNLYPHEIEEFLRRHRQIEDVQVFGVRDAYHGEELCAWIRPRRGGSITDEDVRNFCRGQIAHEKIPRYIEFVAQFPMTASGKVQKFVMRAEAERRLGLDDRAADKSTTAHDGRMSPIP